MALDEDLRPFYAPPLADLVTVKGADGFAHFSNAFAQALGVAGTAPSLRCMAQDVDGVAIGDPVTVQGVNYTVRSIEPIDVGLELLLILERA